jgi:hypothetical protein
MQFIILHLSLVFFPNAPRIMVALSRSGFFEEIPGLRQPHTGKTVGVLNDR